MSEERGSIAQMPEAVGNSQVERVLRLLGFTPHQVVELKIDNSSPATPVLEVELKVARQRIMRSYQCYMYDPHPVRVQPPDSREEGGV